MTRVELRYFPVPTKTPFESSRYAVTVNGVMIGEVRRAARRSREWGAETTLAMQVVGSQNPNKIPTMFERRRDVAIRMIERVFKANPQLIAAAGLS